MAMTDSSVFFALCAAVICSGLFVATRWPAAVLRARYLVLGLLIGVTCLAASALIRTDPWGFRLVIDPSTELLLPANDPGRAAYEASVRDFGDDQIFAIAMESEDAFGATHLEALQRVTNAISTLPGVQRVQSLTDVYSFRFNAEEDWVEVKPFIDDIPEDPVKRQELKARALTDPLYRRTLVSDDGGTVAINVSFRKMTDREFIESGLDAKIVSIVEAETLEGRRFFVAGRPHVKAHVYEHMVRDLRRLIPAALIVISVVLALALRSLRGVLLPIATVLMATLWTFGAIAYLERPLTILTTLLAPTLIAIGATYGVHVMVRYAEAKAQEPDSYTAALRCLEGLRRPMLIAGITTAVGFGALQLTDVPAVFELGAFSVLGIGSLTLISLVGLPAALAVLPGRRSMRPPQTGRGLDAWLAALARMSSRRPGLVIALWGGATLLAALAIPRIVIDTDYLSFFSEDAPVRKDFEAVNRLLSGAIPVYVTLTGAKPGEFRDPDLVRVVWDLQHRLEALPEVSRALSFVDTLARLNRAMAGDDPAQERVPDSRGGVTELLFLFPKGESQRFININHQRANLIVRTGAVGSAAVRNLTQRIEETLAQTDFPASVTPAITGNTILLSRSADGIARAQPRTVGVASLAIFALVTWVLGSWRLGSIAMIPNIVPVVLYFGLLGCGAAPLSLPTSLIGSIALGLAIDATGHYLVRYRDARRAGMDPVAAVEECGVEVGRPIAIASCMLFLGFLTVAMSGFATLQQFGLLSATTMAICFFSDLILLPAVLVRGKI